MAHFSFYSWQLMPFLLNAEIKNQVEVKRWKCGFQTILEGLYMILSHQFFLFFVLRPHIKRVERTSTGEYLWRK